MPASRVQAIPTTMFISGGTKSLTNSPLLVGKTRRDASAMHGSLLRERDRHINVYNPRNQRSDNEYAEFGLGQVMLPPNSLSSFQRVCHPSL